MSKNKKIFMMLAKGGTSQAEIAATLHVSKRDVSKAAKIIREYSLTFDAISSMSTDAVEELFFQKDKQKPNDAYLQQDMSKLVERKKKNRKLPVKLFWIEYCEHAEKQGKLAYSYQMFARLFAEEAKRMGATKHFVHDPGAKCYIDWAGDTAFLTDKLIGSKTKIYVLVVVLPFSNKFWAEGFCDMKQKSWQDGHIHAFEEFGGVPRIWVPDNAATATDRSASIHTTFINKEYERFAQHYGAAVLPARVRKPRDKSVAESVVNLVEQWIINPANEMTFYTLEEFNEFCADRVRWLNGREFTAKEGSRDLIFEEEEQKYLMPLPTERYEMCEWRQAKVAPDYHITIEYMHYSVMHSLIGKQVDVKLTSSLVVIMYESKVVAKHHRLYGRKGQYSTIEDHMPNNHKELNNPWSAERFISWAQKIGPETATAIKRVLKSRVIIEQAFTPCRNILGLSKTYTPSLLERACKKINLSLAPPSYTGLKNTILALKASDVETRRKSNFVAPEFTDVLVDNAKNAGRTRGADTYRRDDI